MKAPALERNRIGLAALVLLLALLAGWWANRETQSSTPSPATEQAAPAPAPAPAVAPESPAGARPSAPPAKPLPPAQHAAEAASGPLASADIFAVHTWEPPPPPAPPPGAAAPAPPPQAPPLPFRFMGRIAEPGAAPVFLLVQGDRVLPVKLGDRIGGAYRLEKFEGGQLFFRYRPMNVMQTLPAGSAP